MRYLIAAPMLAAVMAQPALAQSTWVPGTEIVGQSAQVTTAGVTNTVYFDANGQARIVSPGGQVTPASWTSGGSRLCLYATGVSECWNYTAPFEAQKMTAMSSNCGGLSEFVLSAVNPRPVPPVPPVSDVLGERG